MQLSPLTQTYKNIEAALPKDTILCLKLGDFYEIFFENATIASKIMEVALTKRGEIPMCGFPAHSQNSYIQALTKAGKTVALTEIQKPT